MPDARVCSIPFNSLAHGPPVVAELGRCAALVVQGVLAPEQCRAHVGSIVAARSEWVCDFGGEQFTLGRAFYTHFEQDLSRLYFSSASASNACVERVLPGFQGKMRELVELLTGGVAFQRRGFCGPGVHVFPAGEKVAREGGVIHFDTEGLTDDHCRRKKRALSIIVMLQMPESGAALKVWDVMYAGADHVTSDMLQGELLVNYELGSAVVIDSYRLHQIQPFAGPYDRISGTVHCAELDPGRWEMWF